ncbi:MAG TPA: hypothetical protein VH741_07505 [Candidatus Limnocylindrales bacterium]
MNLFPILLATHIVLAVSLLLPSVLLPFGLRSRGPAPGQSRFGRLLLWLQSNGTLVIGAGLALTGVGMLLTLGPALLGQLWLQVALLIYAANLLAAFFIQRPARRRLLGMHPEASEEERQKWRLRARRQRYVSYAMAAAVGVIAFLMTSKPTL